MTPRERTLAILLIAGIVLAVGGFARLPVRRTRRYQSKHDEADSLEAENQELDDEVKKLQKDAKRLADAKKRSLPADESVAQLEYFAAMDKLLDANVASGFSISPRSPDDRSIPILAREEAGVQRVVFEVQFKKADLWQVHDFLTGYYKLNVLHQITALNIKRDDDTGGSPRPAGTGARNDLTVTFTTEAIILDGAENRRTLLPVPTTRSPPSAGSPGTPP